MPLAVAIVSMSVSSPTSSKSTATNFIELNVQEETREPERLARVALTETASGISPWPTYLRLGRTGKWRIICSLARLDTSVGTANPAIGISDSLLACPSCPSDLSRWNSENRNTGWSESSSGTPGTEAAATLAATAIALFETCRAVLRGLGRKVLHPAFQGCAPKCKVHDFGTCRFRQSLT
jgi:hypothetical protein